MGDSKGGEPVLMSYSRRYTSVAATSNEEVSQIRRRSAAVISNSVDVSVPLHFWYFFCRCISWFAHFQMNVGNFLSSCLNALATPCGTPWSVSVL